MEKELYGQELQISFIRKLRDQQSFDSPELLKKQIEKDIEEALADHEDN